jgi:tRNA dimethylallyltransferase
LDAFHETLPARAVLLVAGPTATGKTALAVTLCEALDGEVVSADSMQLYRGMPIATAAPAPEETRGVPHHLLGVLRSEERCSVAHYAGLAHAAIAAVAARGKLPVLAGGTGLYLQAVAENLTLTEGESGGALRQALQTRASEELWRELRAFDPQSAARLHPNDRKRVIRALELFHSTGVTLTEQNARSRRRPSPYDCRMLLLLPRERQALYERINTRVGRMLERGLLEEVRQAAQSAGATAAQAIGHKELGPWMRGECPLEEAVERLKRETRRYAKRQLSWFGRMAREWNERSPGSAAALYMEDGDLAEQALARIAAWRARGWRTVKEADGFGGRT